MYEAIVHNFMLCVTRYVYAQSCLVCWLFVSSMDIFWGFELLLCVYTLFFEHESRFHSVNCESTMSIMQCMCTCCHALCCG